MIALVMASIFGTGCDSQAFFNCETSVFFQVSSPDGTNQAVVYSRDCGATTAEEIAVAIVPAGEQVGDRLGTVVYSSRVRFAPEELMIEWRDPTHVVVTSPDENPRINQSQIEMPSGSVVRVDIE